MKLEWLGGLGGWSGHRAKKTNVFQSLLGKNQEGKQIG